MSSANSTHSAILKYLTASNRPYSVNDIVNNLHKEYGKSAVTKALETLIENGAVIEKVYGKQKVYIRNQDHLPVSSEHLKKINAQIVQISQELKDSQESLKQASVEFDALNNCLSVKQLTEKINFSEKNNAELRSKVDLIKQKVGNVNADDFKRSHDELQRRNHLWSNRKRISNTVLNAVLDGFPQDKKALLEEIGFEGDK